jgi:hypothetical protein
MDKLIGYYDPKRFEKILERPGWIRDLREELEHGPSSPTILGPEERRKFCEDLGGREPEAHESASIINHEGKDCFFPIFSDTKTDDWYATKTKVAWSERFVRIVNYGHGRVGYYDKDYRYYVRPVRPMPVV